jgi:hypothetical protein
MNIALTNHALERAMIRGVDINSVTKVVQRCATMLREKEVKLKVGDLVIVARRDKNNTPVVITTWREKKGGKNANKKRTF